MCSNQTTNMIIPQKADCVYTLSYCEENIWHLAKLILDLNKATSDLKAYVILLSNSNKCVHLWKQNSPQKDGLLFWDYHAFMITEHQDQTMVFDFDTTLPFPVSFSQYCKEALRNDLKEIQTWRFFRVVEANTYLTEFSSDRGHMLEGDHWLAEPPNYPPILNKKKEHNLESFISMECSNEYGQVLNLDEFKARFS
ncbi:Protein N-terminal glutamine amidohydrolase, alpha beta roll [Cinara cedri]|uniref:Protein N-terminal glutamine amidohydrolase n=1 Tax=Cinara cedri TaxID=506608 RepID=A0A5E4N009_9HEMI|nr:Protein N-terminal glutamine amidohydrolase, alpha beta roll [Cinara cedri]